MENPLQSASNPLRGRLSYWNGEYASYWRERVAEADASTSGPSSLVESDSKTLDFEGLNRLLDFLPVTPGQRVLDVACGFGRAFPYFLDHGLEIVGTDISKTMLDMAPESLRQDGRVTLALAEAERLPFRDGTFDAVVVVAAFDAFEQHHALSEVLRVCRTGGYVLLMGKNSRYCQDDDQAIIAERNARRKGHPNYFTDFGAFTRGLTLAASIERELYFVRRDDFPPMHYQEVRPAEFYMYMVVAKRLTTAAPKIDNPIASGFSNTWEECGVGLGE